MPANSDDRRSLVLAVVGVGPRGAGLLERLVTNAAEVAHGPVEIHLVDPFPPGAVVCGATRSRSSCASTPRPRT